MKRRLVRSILVASLVFGGGALTATSASAITDAPGGGIPSPSATQLIQAIPAGTGSGIPSVVGAIASIGVVGARAIGVIAWCTFIGC